ncbi:T. brucei spp.-specific protein [Trypanosoma brucei gambiense DAL972]|uniref:T. brucei spp.-specific protein n=1 Tax=Trypanosoma brucei gambiense (strain MHOM/CI/86/DAL972) TaxID=679716 RepID=C9ZQJ1_TRYB9|nr:T. brucei spp.-specific protein [Trypanosoma brucei gambiense DAL972]CBH11671.1 T. brucei spp.-specific protein [Trypanosoma brucei gambiense DAL972]|eukprot:XP_011773956.1 T. brucei spp.-specific protein [Trypanosoma brucei gambiense DAL972]
MFLVTFVSFFLCLFVSRNCYFCFFACSSGFSLEFFSCFFFFEKKKYHFNILCFLCDHNYPYPFLKYCSLFSFFFLSSCVICLLFAFRVCTKLNYSIMMNMCSSLIGPRSAELIFSFFFSVFFFFNMSHGGDADRFLLYFSCTKKFKKKKKNQCEEFSLIVS